MTHPTEDRLRGFIDTLAQGLRDGRVTLDAHVELAVMNGDFGIVARGLWHGVAKDLEMQLTSMKYVDFLALETRSMLKRVDKYRYNIVPAHILQVK